jgi:hypothetical protein
MPFPKNQVSVFGAKIKAVETRYTQDSKQITTVQCYEYQGSKNDKPEGITWNLELWEKTAKFFTDKNPQPDVDYIAFSGSVIDKSFDGDNGRVYRQSVRINNIEILKPRDSFNETARNSSYDF